MIVAGIIAAFIFVLALSRSAGLADRRMEEIHKVFRHKRGGWHRWGLT